MNLRIPNVIYTIAEYLANQLLRNPEASVCWLAALCVLMLYVASRAVRGMKGDS